MWDKINDFQDIGIRQWKVVITEMENQWGKPKDNTNLLLWESVQVTAKREECSGGAWYTS